MKIEKKTDKKFLGKVIAILLIAAIVITYSITFVGYLF